jgi:hypothetical protein
MANIDFQYQLTPKGQELAREVSNETVKTTKKMMQKFDGDTINNFINGKTKSSKNKEYASNKTKNVKSKNNTASKIKPLPQGAEMIDMLNKIHTFLQRNSEQDNLHRERLNNYMEENLAEAKARHDKLLEAIKKLTKDMGYGKEMPTATKDVPPEQEKSILDYILDAFGLGKDVKDVFNIVKEIVKVARGSPLAGGMAIAALAGAIVGYVLPWVRNRDKELNPENYKDVPSEIAAQEGKTNKQAGAQNQRKAVAKMRYPAVVEMLKANPEALSEMTGMSIPELNDWVSSSKPTDVLSYTPISERNKATPIPSGYQNEAQQQEDGNGGSTPTASPTPAAAAPTPSQQLNNVVAENNDAKISEATAPPSVNTINNTVASGSKQEVKNAPKLDLPSVRNQEETFRRMIFYSTRVV